MEFERQVLSEIGNEPVLDISLKVRDFGAK